MCNIQVFLDFANFYQYFIQDFSKIAGPLILMLKTTSPTSSSIILQSSIDAADEDEIGRNESNGNKINLSNPSASKKSTGAGYLTFKGTKKGDGNTNSGGGNSKKSVKATKISDYLTLNTKKSFNHLQHAFTQAPIL